MISATTTSKAGQAITSDRWHVVHASFITGDEGPRPFHRAIVSEHDDRIGAVRSARVLLATLRQSCGDRKRDQRDQVFVRRPGFVSLLNAPRGKTGRS
jgi:hypothetical protein